MLEYTVDCKGPMHLPFVVVLQEEEKKLKEAEKRRRKLENMRQKISDENLSTEIESDLDDNESDRSDRNYHSDSSNEAADSAVDEPDSYHPSEVSKRLTFSENMDTSHPNKVKMEKDIPALDVDDILSESDDFVDKLLQDNQVCSDSNEPDIVRSTRTPPNTLTSLPPSVMEQLASTSQNSHSLSLPPPAQASQPRAPPRRRRKETEQPFNEVISYSDLYMLYDMQLIHGMRWDFYPIGCVGFFIVEFWLKN